MFTNNLKSTLYILLCLFVLISSCKKDDEELKPPLTDVNGDWIVLERNYEDCSELSIPTFFIDIVSVNQEDNDLSITFTESGDMNHAKISAEKVTCNVSLTYGEGHITAQFTGYIQEDLNTVEGDATWTLNVSEQSCKGTSKITAIRSLPPSVDISGYWTGTCTTEEGENDLSFEIVQDDAIISGTGIMSEYDMGKEMVGIVSGNTVLIGDADYDDKFFVGTATASSILGVFYDIHTHDRVDGTWQVSKNDSVSVSIGTVTDSIYLPVGSMWYGGLVVTDSKVIRANRRKVFIYNYLTSTIDSILHPFVNEDCAIAYDGTALTLTKLNDYDNSFFYKINPAGGDLIKTQVTYEIKGLAYDGEYFWIKEVLSDRDQVIHRIDNSGNILKTISCRLYSDKYGLAYDGSNLWYPYYDKLIKSDINGNILRTLDFSSISSIKGIACDGLKLWFGSSLNDNIYQSDTSGTLQNTINGPEQSPLGLAWDGSNLWFVSDALWEEKLYKLDASGSVLIEESVSDLYPAGLACDGTDLWIINDENEMLYRINPDLTNLFNANVIDIKHIAYDNTSRLWVLHGGSSDNIQMSMLNDEGTVLSSFSLPQRIYNGMVCDGTYLWLLCGGDSPRLYKYSSQGNVIAVYTVDNRFIGSSGLAFDGNNLWCFMITDTETASGYIFKFIIPDE